jgi:hypothetical protein
MVGKSMAVASKIRSSRWKALTPEARAPFEARARALKEELKESKRTAQLEGSRAPLPSGWKAVRDSMTGRIGYTCLLDGRCQWTRPGDADAVAVPSPPPTARRLFEDSLKESGEATSAKAASAQWNALSDAEKQPFVKAAADLRVFKPA